jgi:hypothetical protein
METVGGTSKSSKQSVSFVVEVKSILEHNICKETKTDKSEELKINRKILCMTLTSN